MTVVKNKFYIYEMDDNQKTLDAINDDFDLSDINTEDPEPKQPITLWLPVEYKLKFDLIQQRSKKRFGKHLKEVLKRSIDKIDIEKGA